MGRMEGFSLGGKNFATIWKLSHGKIRFTSFKYLLPLFIPQNLFLESKKICMAVNWLVVLFWKMSVWILAESLSSEKEVVTKCCWKPLIESEGNWSHSILKNISFRGEGTVELLENRKVLTIFSKNILV